MKRTEVSPRKWKFEVFAERMCVTSGQRCVTHDALDASPVTSLQRKITKKDLTTKKEDHALSEIDQDQGKVLPFSFLDHASEGHKEDIPTLSASLSSQGIDEPAEEEIMAFNNVVTEGDDEQVDRYFANTQRIIDAIPANDRLKPDKYIEMLRSGVSLDSILWEVKDCLRAAAIMKEAVA